jgi:DNA replication protein DnaC
MTEKLEKTLKKLGDAISEAEPQSSSTKSRPDDALGDPKCPHCGGVGFLRVERPVSHPEFGKVQPCICRQDALSERIGEKLFSLSKLDELRRLTFESFNPEGRIKLGEYQRRSLKEAYTIAQSFAQNPKGWLVIQGNFGSGKTHLAAAIANYAVSSGVPTLFLTVPDLLDSLRTTFESKEVSFDNRFEQIRSAPLLILDDFGTQNTTEWAREKLFQILNYRYINQIPMVVTTNLAMQEIEGRMRSRISDSELVTNVKIQAPDYRLHDDEYGHPELSTLQLHSKQTFGTFVLRKGDKLLSSHVKSLEEAFDSAREYAENPQGWIAFKGLHGTGKTHLAAAIANRISSRGESVIFVVVADMLDQLRATFSPTSNYSYDHRFEEIRTTPLLVLDDLESESMSQWVREKLYQILNHRQSAGLPTVITTADAPDKINPRIDSKLKDQSFCVEVTIDAPPYKGKRLKSR